MIINKNPKATQRFKAEETWHTLWRGNTPYAYRNRYNLKITQGQYKNSLKIQCS